ncbi:MAG: LuxR C-terminal-related transcriptional regulator [Caldilineaceae bacterium]
MNEPFSGREIEILGLAAEGYANNEIAHRLSLSLNTVKWYNKQIYTKLAVENRTQAIQRAKKLGLLSEPNAQNATPPFNNLPTLLTKLVGRRDEIETAKHLLKHHRLLTLTGPGGIGKTRLALCVAEELVGFFPHGICFVDLSTISEAGLVPNTIAHLLGLAESLDRPQTTLLQEALRDKQFLLLLDNFEHLLDAALLVSDLLATCPQLSVLITSREVLALYGEQEYSVPPLQLPDLEWLAVDQQMINDILTCESLQLFERAAQAIYPEFRLTTENATTIAGICLRLDGLPLALELAAAYTKLLPPKAILEQLDSMWLEMKRSLRNVPLRQQTLRNTIEWSYRFLNPEERQLFAQMAVFRGGCDWAAIVGICTPSSPTGLLDSLNGLVNKSLVWRKDNGNSQPRFGMLETIREYAQRCLQEKGQVEELRQRHALYYTQYTSRVEADLMSMRQRLILNQLEIEVDNFRSALRWALDHDPEPGLRMIGDLATCWRIRGYLTEGMTWAEQLLSTERTVSVSVHAKAYASASNLARILGHQAQAIQLAEKGLSLAQTIEDAQTLALTFHALAVTKIAPHLSTVEYDGIAQLCNEAMRFYEACHNQLGQVRMLNLLGEIKRMQDRFDEAKDYYEECLIGLRQLGYQSGVTAALNNLGWVSFHISDYSQALHDFAEGFKLSYELNYPHNIAMSLNGVAAVLSRLGQAQIAAQLMGVTQAIRKSIGVVMDLADEPDYERTLLELQTNLGPDAYNQCWQTGQKMSINEAKGMLEGWLGKFDVSHPSRYV